MSLSGYRAVDDRRRRHLVLDTERDGSAPSLVRGEKAAPVNAVTELARLMLDLPRFVPERRWKYVVTGAASLAGVTSLLLAWLFAEEAASAGSTFGDIVSPLTDRLLRGTGAAMWWLTGQLCVVAWWVRSRSGVDYSGRFHAWGWTAAGFCFAAVLNLTGAHQLVAQLMAWSYGGSVVLNSVGPLAVWLLPSLVMGLLLWSTLGAELRGCWPSRVLHALATTSALTLVGVELWSARTGSSLRTEFISRLLLSILQWSNLMTVLCHVRHVVHVTADPPAERPSAFILAWSHGPVRLWAWFVQMLNHGTNRFPKDEAATNALPGRRTRLESPDGNSKDLRVDDAEPTAKGPSRRTKQASRK